jgi:hypothetical protein
MKLLELLVPNANIEWDNGVEAVPATSKKEGNVTINNMGTPGRPAHFTASFSMYAKADVEGQETVMYFTPSIPVSGFDKSAPFIEVEDAAVLKLAAFLRAIADDCERQVATFDIKTDPPAEEAAEEGNSNPLA